MAVLVFLLLAAIIMMLTLFYLQFRWRNRHILSVAYKLPCPPTYPLLGNCLMLLGDVTDFTKTLIHLKKQFKGIYCCWVGPVPHFVVSSPEDVQIVLNSSNTLHKGTMYHFHTALWGDGLLSLPVPSWRKYRRVIEPVLHPSNVDQFLPSFNDISRNVTKCFAGSSKASDPSEAIGHSIIDSVLINLAGRSPWSSITKRNVQYALHVGGIVAIERASKVWLQVDWIYKLLYNKRLNSLLNTKDKLMKIVEQMFREEEEIRNEIKEKSGIFHIKDITQKNMFDVWYMNISYEEDNHDWKAEFAHMIAAATETTSAVLPFILFTLASHPDVQKKVQEEIDEVVGDSERDLTASDLSSLIYLGQTIKETLRIHGTVPIIFREVTNATKLTSCTLPPGSRILLPLQAMGWDEDIFPEPEKFIPQRFSPENMKHKHKYAFVPFSGGPRNCIGKYYAMQFMKMMLVNILKRFTVTTDMKYEELEYDYRTVMFTKNELLMKFEPK